MASTVAIDKAQTFVCTFAFPGFSKLGFAIGEEYVSEKAHFGDDCVAGILYPGGSATAAAGNVSFYVKNYANKILACSLKVEVMDAKIPGIKRLDNFLIAANARSGWCDFAARSYILNPAKRALKEDCLLIRATFTVTPPAAGQAEPTCIQDGDSYVYKAGPDTALTNLLAFHDGEPLQHDFAIAVGALSGGEMTIPVHKLILAARSPVFRAMLSSGMKESCADEMEITGFAVEAVRAFVRFLYCDACTEATLSQHGWELLSMADKYDVPALRFVCETYLALKLGKATAITTLQRADMLSAPVLKRKALDYIAQNKKAVSENPALLQELHAELLREVVLAQAK